MKASELLGEKAIQPGAEGIAQPLAAFFASRLPEARQVKIANIGMPPADSGFSAENFIIDLTWLEGSTPRDARYVVRRQSKSLMFPGRSFSREWRIQDALARKTDLPVPKIFAHEDDEAVLDGRFYVMEYLRGETPPAVSPHETGMLVDLSTKARRKLWFSGLAELGKLHRLDARELGLDFMSQPAQDGSELTTLLDYWEQHYLSSSDGKPLPLMVDAIAWLRSNRLEEREPSVVWGDARIGNMLFDEEQNCVGIVDWELTSLGEPLQDLAYWTYSDDHFIHIASQGALSGWPSSDETIAAYEAASGQVVDRKRLAYYRLVAGYWIICTLSQLVAIKKRVGQFPAELEVTEAAFTPVSFFSEEFTNTKASWSN